MENIRYYLKNYNKKKKLPPLALLASPGGLGTETLRGVGKS
jgi:hypothetical protein